MFKPTTLNHFPSNATPRSSQVFAINETDRLTSEGKTIIALQAPCGVGKSHIAIAYAKQAESINQKTFILSPQKNLQDQYSRTWPSPIIESLKGRSSYSCSYEPHLIKDASRGYCRRVKKKGLIEQCLKYGTTEAAQLFELPPDAHKCDYWRQLQLAIESPITLFNFHSFLFQQRLNRFGKRNLLIIDEAHGVEGTLLQFVEIAISDKLMRLVGVRLDLTLKTAQEVLAWLEKEKVVSRIRKAIGAEPSEDVPQGFSASEAEQLRALLERIDDLLRYLDMTEWIVDVTEDPTENGFGEKIRKLRIRPVFISPFTKEFLWSKADQVIAMSATILDPKTWARNLGIAQKCLGFVDIPSSFPIKNRPIIPEYAGNMSWRTMDAALPKLYSKIKEILDRHAGVRGIIHGHSERLCRLIRDNVRSPRILHLDMFEKRDKTAMLRAHELRPDSVLLASGMSEGIDLRDEMSRFQVIAKVPWPNTQDRFVKKRMEVDGSYLSYQAALKICQSSGRSVRHESDFAITYVADEGFETFLTRCAWLLPKWFTEAVQKPHKR